jgi:hypothetical protein
MDYEVQRVQLAYERRKQQKPSRLYSYFNKACLESYQQRERVLLYVISPVELNKNIQCYMGKPGLYDKGVVCEF